MSKLIYLDNAATTSVKPEVFEAMKPYYLENYSNPSSVYSFAGEAKKAMEDARKVIADSLGAAATEIYFTGGGSESDNWVLKGVAEAYQSKGKHIITSKIEHHAILHTCEYLEKHGYEVTYLDVDENGLVAPEEVEKAIRPDTILISIMFANNEIGTIMPIREIGAVCRAHKVLLHTDAVQAAGHIPIDVTSDNIDLLTLTAHKFHGPKGVGAVYIRQGVRVPALIVGGGQEKGLRAGTENTAGIIGMGLAAAYAKENMEANAEKTRALRDKLIEGILAKIPEVRLNGHPTDRLPNNVNVSIRYIEGEGLLLLLDHMGIAASSGSACTSGSLDPSHVLLAIGLPHEIAHGSLRLTLSEENSSADVDYVLEQLPLIVEKLRAMSPLYHK
jgi:cysteine desulfurase